MKVSGFTFIRNAITYDYPIKEAIESILPLCNEFVVAVGNSDDETRDLIRSIAPEKIKIVDTVWDDSLREGGKVLAVETNKAKEHISRDSDWCFYIQGDEVFHEDGIESVKKAMTVYKDDPSVNGLLFNYHHFFGSYDYVGTSSAWYRKEIRIIKNDPSIYSYRDAQGFRIGNNNKLRVKPVNAWIHHYGWVKDPRAMQRKQENFHKLWHDDNWVEENVAKSEEFDYGIVDALAKFGGTHPNVMLDRINNKGWKFDYDLSMNNLPFKERARKFIREKLGWDIGYKNYRL